MTRRGSSHLAGARRAALAAAALAAAGAPALWGPGAGAQAQPLPCPAPIGPVRAGDSFEVPTAGLVAGTSLRVTGDGVDLTLMVPADAAPLQAAIPRDLPAGEHAIVATGAVPGGGSVSVACTVRVVSALDASAPPAAQVVEQALAAAAGVPAAATPAPAPAAAAPTPAPAPAAARPAAAPTPASPAPAAVNTRAALAYTGPVSPGVETAAVWLLGAGALLVSLRAGLGLRPRRR